MTNEKYVSTGRSLHVLVSLPFELLEKYIQIQILLRINKGNLQDRKVVIMRSFITNYSERDICDTDTKNHILLWVLSLQEVLCLSLWAQSLGD